MLTEITVTNADASEAIALIREYLEKGGTGFDYAKLETMLEALQEADRIVIGGEQ